MSNTAIVPIKATVDEGSASEGSDNEGSEIKNKDVQWNTIAEKGVKSEAKVAKTEAMIQQHRLAKELETKKMQQGGFTKLFGTWWHWTQLVATSTNIISLIAFALVLLTVGLTYKNYLNKGFELDEGTIRFQVDFASNSSNTANFGTNFVKNLKNHIQTINPELTDINVLLGYRGNGKKKMEDSNIKLVIEIKAALNAWTWCTDEVDEESCTDTEKLYCDAIDHISKMRNTINKPTRMLRVYNNLYPHSYGEQATTFCWMNHRQNCATSCMANFKCPELVAPPRSTMSCDHGFFGSFHYSAACTFECNPNYILNSGNATLRCNRDGKWDGMLPDCMLNWNAITA